jgi:hypothetical protein
MYDSLRKLLPDNLSDESAYHLANIFYDLALAFESINLGKIMRYENSGITLSDHSLGQDRVQEQSHAKEEDSHF